jgi:hypothetical protein
MNETLLIITQGKHHKVSIFDDDGNALLTLRILGLSKGVNVDLTIEEEGVIKVKEHLATDKVKTVWTERSQQ